jgi:hypothetical protein
MEQAFSWHSHFRSVAVPYQRKGLNELACSIAKDYLKIGILCVGNGYSFEVKEIISPALMRENRNFCKRYYFPRLQNFPKNYLEAGSKGGGYYTPYKETMHHVHTFICDNPGCSLKQIIEGVKGWHYGSTASAITCIRRALENWEKDWCEVKKEGNRTTYFVRSGLERKPYSTIDHDRFHRSEVYLND